jgi:hypothetical protein
MSPVWPPDMILELADKEQKRGENQRNSKSSDTNK